MIEHIKIGGHFKNNLIIKETDVSGMHAELFKDNESRVFLTDLNSKNGTYVNGKRIEGSLILKRGDEVKLANKHIVEWENLLFESEEIESPFSMGTFFKDYWLVLLIFGLDIMFFILIMNSI